MNLRKILDNIQNPTIDDSAIMQDAQVFTGAGTYPAEVGTVAKVIDLYNGSDASALVNIVLVLALYIESVVDTDSTETYKLLIEESDDIAFGTIPDFTELIIDPLADDGARIAKVLLPSHRYIRLVHVLGGTAPVLTTKLGFNSPYAKR